MLYTKTTNDQFLVLPTDHKLSRFTTSQVLVAVGPNGFMSVAAICVVLRHLLQLERQRMMEGETVRKGFF